MPIIIKDYTWKQNDEKIIVRVPLKGADLSKADIFTFDNFIKVHCPPFLFEVCLRDLINEKNSICRVARSEIIFELEKNERGPWDVLEAALTKAEIVDVKKRAIELSLERNKAEKETKIVKKQEIRSLAIKDQVALDTKERNKIDLLREHEKTVAMNELEQWKQEQRRETQNEIAAKYKNNPKHENKECYHHEDFSSDQDKKQESDFDSNNEKEETCQDIKDNEPSAKYFVKKISSGKEIFEDPRNKMSKSKSLLKNNNKYEKNNKLEIPNPRNSGRIGVTFTPRAFPTPSRESKQLEENEWLQKQAEARRRAGFVIEDLRPEEHDPVWLKDKGDSFYKVGNYVGAISAYSHGIKLNQKVPALYSNRAAAHLALGNLRRVVQDTSKALELLVPCIDMNASSRSLCHARRGAALCQLNVLKSGLADLEEALKLCPNNKELEYDIKVVKEKLENPDFISEEEEDENSKENNEIGFF